MPASAEIFASCPNGVFVETGSYLGDGIQAALNAGFARIISIELSDKYFDICQKRFAHEPRVTLVKGDSAMVLADILRDIQEPITFWLDGHWSAGDTAKGVHTIPLLQELSAIRGHSVKNHTVLIDDMRCWKQFNPMHGFDEQDVMTALDRIGAHTHTFLDSPHAAADILLVRFLS